MKTNDADMSDASQRDLAAGVLKQAAQDLRRFRGATSNQGRCFQRRRRKHDPWLVVNMSIFNFELGRSEMFNPIRSHQNIWC